MTQLASPVDPFGEVNVYRQKNGQLEIVATVLMEPSIEGARCGLALDGSASMKSLYGHSGLISPLFKQASGVSNVVEPVVQTMAPYLARFSSEGRVNLIYWAVAADGSQIEEIGEVTEAEAQRLTVVGPRKQAWGRGTKLLPPLRHFVERAFPAAPWAICVFVTDGIIEDLAEVKSYSLAFAKQIAAGRRAFIKLVLLGVGASVDEKQMTELDDMFESSGMVDPRGHDIDLWDHKLARDMRHLAEIFAEVVTKDTIVADHGRILDSAGRAARDYPDGLPALLRFTLPAGSTSFTLVLPGSRVTQELT